jgi:hypothetical protein
MPEGAGFTGFSPALNSKGLHKGVLIPVKPTPSGFTVYKSSFPQKQKQTPQQLVTKRGWKIHFCIQPEKNLKMYYPNPKSYRKAQPYFFFLVLIMKKG